jgi:hypothetical protein
MAKYWEDIYICTKTLNLAEDQYELSNAAIRELFIWQRLSRASTL